MEPEIAVDVVCVNPKCCQHRPENVEKTPV